MAGRIEPSTLADLAVATLIKYIDQQFCTPIYNLCRKNELPAKKSLIDNKSKYLHNFFRDSSLPPVIANELTRQLLKSIDDAYWNEPMYRNEPWFTDTMHSVVAAILPPTLTKLDLGSKHSHNTGDHSFNFVIHPVYQEIKKLEQLRFLRLDYLYTGRTTHICNGFPKYLETVTTCGFFTDEDLKLLVDTCKNLKYLNISRSEKVTDTSIEHILQINNLLGLYVVDTRISRDGITQIIKGLSAMQGNESCSQNLQKFGCSFPTENHFNMLIQDFSNINELWLENCDGNDLIPITKLEKLVSLHLGMVENSGVFCHQALPILGERLVLLKLTKCYDFDLVQIGVSCKTLKCLHLTESGSTEDFPSNEVPCFSPDTQYPGFLTIECLQIELEYDPDMTESVLKQCLNVKKLNITLHEPEEFYILECQPLKEVEEIIWSPSAWIDMTFANQLLDSAQKLHIVIGLSFEEGPNYYRGVKFYDYI